MELHKKQITVKVTVQKCPLMNIRVHVCPRGQHGYVIKLERWSGGCRKMQALSTFVQTFWHIVRRTVAFGIVYVHSWVHRQG